MDNTLRDAQEPVAAGQKGSFADLFDKVRSLAADYKTLPNESLRRAFDQADPLANPELWDPYIQNRRVKAIGAVPVDYSKDQIADFIKKPGDHEKPLRQAVHALEYASYPLRHTRMVYQNLLTYHNYIAPHLVSREKMKKPAFWRHWEMLERIREAFRPADLAHEIAGQAMQEGKVFYTYRVDADKESGECKAAFAQQLPSEWCKIVGFNDVSKYTVAFDLMYFTEPGTDPAQFPPDLFIPYMDGFMQALPGAKRQKEQIVYAQKGKVNMKIAERMGADAYFENGRWFYWVTLPADQVFTFEIDDADRIVVSPFTGLLIDMVQLSQLAAIQLELVQNPLVSLLTGEIPYHQHKTDGEPADDAYKLSPAGRNYFMREWSNMLAASNTGGIGLYAAPFENMKLHSLAEAPSAMDIVSKGYQDTMGKAGLSAIIPTTADARAGAVDVSLRIESKFAKQIYSGMERMMNAMIRSLRLAHEFRFHMFGDIATDEKLEKQCEQAMTLGILPDTIIYNALHDRSVLDDMCWSAAIRESGLLDDRIPLVSSYSAKQGESGLPPKGEGGRPETDGATSDGKESDMDGGVAK